MKQCIYLSAALLLSLFVVSFSFASTDKYLKKAKVLFRKGQPERALKYINHAFKKGRPSSKLFLMKARILVKLRRLEEAVKVLNDGEANGKTTLKSLILRSRCLLALGHRKQARKDAEWAFKMAPQSKMARALMKKLGAKKSAPVKATAFTPKASRAPKVPKAPKSAIAMLLPAVKKIGTKIKLPGGIEMTYVPPGAFTMGSKGSSGQDCPAHKVTLTKGFWIGVHEVTQGQWTAVMASNPSEYKGAPDLPVEAVTYEQCLEFCSRLSRKVGRVVRLPYEAEWEYAARAGNTSACYGRANDISWNKKNCNGKTQPVGKKKPNDWGLYDTLGNVYEMCGGVWYRYTKEDAVDPIGPDEGFVHAYRGGSIRFGWNTFYSRYQISNGVPKKLVGFRIVLADEEKLKPFRPKPKPQKGSDGEKVLAAAKSSDWVKMRKLVVAGADITKVDEYGYNALHIAVQYGDFKTVQLLLNKGADYNQHTKFFKTPLYLALDRRELSMPIVQLLVEAGANVNFNFGGCYPMKAAVLKNHAEAVNYLLEKGAKIDVKMAVESHLHIACMHGCLETVLVLAKSKAQTELRDFKKRTPLISAAASHSANDERMVKMCEFLVKRGANIDAVDEKGATALHHAASRYRPKTVAALLRLGADATRKDKKGKTALERARMYHQKNPHYGTEVIKKLESR